MRKIQIEIQRTNLNYLRLSLKYFMYLHHNS